MQDVDVSESEASEGQKDGAGVEAASAPPAEEDLPVEEELPIDEPAMEKERRPSCIIEIRNLPAEVEASEVEMRLLRFGDLISVQLDDELVIAKYSTVIEADAAQQKLHGARVGGLALDVRLGPPEETSVFERPEGDAAHAAPAAAEASVFDRPAPIFERPDAEKHRATPVECKEPTRPADGLAGVRGKHAGVMRLPENPISMWSESGSLEAQLEDFAAMDRRGMYNRYLVAGRLTPDLRTEQALLRSCGPVQRDVVKVEILKCYGKPVAHLALRSATAAAELHRFLDHQRPELTVAFAPPHRAARTLWLGNVDDHVDPRELDDLLTSFGALTSRIAYQPARTCAWATFEEVEGAVAARNALYGLELRPGRYLNVDFVSDQERAPDAQEGSMPGSAAPWAMGPQGAPWSAPWGGWEAQGGAWGWPQANKPLDDRWARYQAGEDAEPDRDGRWRPPSRRRSASRRAGRGRRRSPSRSQTRSRSRHRNREEGRRRPPKARSREREDDEAEREAHRRAKRMAKRQGNEKREAARAASPEGARASSDEGDRAPVKLSKKGKEGGSKTKSKVKLFKMGEFCCTTVASLQKASMDAVDPLPSKLAIDQRTKIDHCRSHLERAGDLAAVWHLSAAERRDCAAYDALCDYFVEKQRVGLVQTPTHYVYLVPPTAKYLKELKLPNSNFAVGIQIPAKKDK